MEPDEIKMRKIIDAQGKEHFAPIKLNKYEKYGYPMPAVNSVPITESEIALAKAFTAKGKRDKLVILYLRDEPVVQQYVETAKFMGEEVSVPRMRAVRGNPIACLVGFNTGFYVQVGWSKWNTKLDDDGVPFEKLEFTKKDALKCAVLRGIIDTITISASGRSAKTKDGTYIPKCIERALPKFIERVKRCYGKDISNVFYTPA